MTAVHPALSFSVVDSYADIYAASPQLQFRLRATEQTGETVHAIALRAQVMIEPQRRPYDETEAAGVAEIFGGRDRWRQTLKPFMWTQANAMVKGFQNVIDFELPVPCSYDFEVSAAKYLQALSGGDIPLRFLFSGTVFTRGETGFSVTQVPWSLESGYRMPVSQWREVIDQFFPNTGWIRLDREMISELVRFKAARGLTTWDAVMESLLASATESASLP